MATWLKQSTAVDVKIGPFLDETDGKTAETGLTITQPDIRLAKNGGAFAQKNAAQTLTHEENGWYEIALDTTDTGTLGILIVAVHESGALPCWREFLVVPANVYDSLVGGSDALDVSLIQWLGSAPNALVSSRVDASVGAMAANVLTATAINADAITAAKVADGTIDSGTFAAGAINAAALASDAIQTAKIQDGALTAAKFGADFLTAAKVAADVGTELAAAVWAAATRTLTALGFTLGAADLAADTITAAKIAPDAIGASELAADAVSEIAAAISVPAASAVADAVWDEALAGHVGAGSAGKALSDLAAAGAAPTAAAVADAVWDEAIDTDVSDVAGVALCVVGTEVWLFYLDDDDTTIRLRVSADNGATWGAASTVLATGGAKTWIAAAASDGSGSTNGDVLLLWSEGADVYRARYAGSWGARTLGTNAPDSVTGLAVAYLLDWQVIITGEADAAAGPKVMAARYGDGVNQATDTWGTLREVTGAALGSDVSFGAPSVGYESDAWRLFFVESFAGDAAYARLQWSTLSLLHDFNEEQWREPVALEYDGAKGAAVAIGASRVWLCSAEAVYSSALPGYDALDASGEVLEARVDVDGGGSRVELVLDPSLWGEALLARGVRLQLTPGYRTTAGAEVALPYGYWVESVELETGARPVIRVVARDGWALLGDWEAGQRVSVTQPVLRGSGRNRRLVMETGWRARRQFVWAAGSKSIGQVLLFLLARAGLSFASDGSSAVLSTFKPAFTVHAGESGATAVRRLLAMVEDLARWDGAQLVSLLSDAGDGSGYAIGTSHVVVEALYRADGPQSNRVRVIGLGCYAEAEDFADVAATGERMLQVVDVNLTAGSHAEDRAAALLRKAAIGAIADELRLFGVHAGVELWDVVDVTDVAAGLDEALRRVTAYAWRFEAAKGRYDVELTLGAV